LNTVTPRLSRGAITTAARSFISVRRFTSAGAALAAQSSRMASSRRVISASAITLPCGVSSAL